MLTALLVAVGGGLGAAARFVVDGLVRHRRPGRTDRLPLATLVVNVTGSLLAGVVLGAQLYAGLGPRWATVAAVGFCGGYTTFSTAMVEALDLHRDGDHRAALAATLGMLVACVAAAALGVLVVGLAAGAASLPAMTAPTP